MNIENRIENFRKLDSKTRLDSWEELVSISKDFIESKSRNTSLAKIIADEILGQRLLMGSSKAYEGATDIDLILCEVCVPIARVGYEGSKRLVEFLKSELYYANYYPDKFDKTKIENEIRLINDIG